MADLFERSFRFLRGQVARRQARRYDAETLAVMDRALDRSSTGVDVGAHKGIMLDAIVSRAPNGRHFAFEPIPRTVAQLQRRFAGQPNVEIFPHALAAESGRASFQHVVSRPTYSGLVQRRMDRPNEQIETIEVSRARLDDVIPNEQPVHFVKIDVEGGELGVLQGGFETLARTRPIVVFEHGLGGADRYGTTPGQMFDLLDEAGLRVSLMARWLGALGGFSRAELEDHFYRGRNYYFIAYPP